MVKHPSYAFCVERDGYYSIHKTSQREDLPSPSPLFPYVLVGMGEEGINCGQPHLGLMCQDCFQHHWGISQCNQKQCPTCYTEWIDKTFRTAYSRLTDPKNIIKNKYKRLNHIILSPDPSISNQVMVGTIKEERMRGQAREYLQQKSPVYITTKDRKPIPATDKKMFEKYGFKEQGKNTMTIPKEEWDKLEEKESKRHQNFRRKVGITRPQIIRLIYRTYKVSFSYPDGILVYHPYRLNDKGKHEYDLYVAEMKTEDAANKEIMQKWEWLRHHHSHDWLHYVTYSPHYHFIGWTGYLAPARKDELFVIEKKPGLSYITNGIITKEQKKREHLLVQHTFKQTKMVIKKMDLIRAIRYPLTHTVDRTDTKNYHSYVWIGKLSTRYGKTDKEKQLEQYQDIIKINEEKTKKHTCKKCGSTLGYIKPTIDKFFQDYENIHDTGWYTYPDLINMVKNNTKITPEQQENMMDILQTLENYKLGKPPPKPIAYII